jgi:recombination protein RecA
MEKETRGKDASRAPGNETVISEKRRAAEQTAVSLNRQMGPGTVMRLGDEVAKFAVEIISTGAIALDIALGVGGIPRGRVVEIFGPESSGKTTLALHIIASAQRGGGIAAFIDVEHALDPAYAANLGVDVDNLYVSQPDTGEQALEIMEAFARSNAVDCIVLDSVAALVPKAEIEGEMGEMQVGLQARLMSQAMRKLTAVIGKSNCCAVFINQIREKIGVLFGSPETTPGGRALKFHSSVRLDVRRAETLKNGGETIGSRMKVKVVKNKVAPPFREAELEMYYGKGISATASLIDVGVAKGIIEKGGTWYNYGDRKLGQGRERVREYLELNPALMAELDAIIRRELKKPASAGAEEPEPIES